MRIQETDRILKESRYMRHANGEHDHDKGVLARVWGVVSGLPSRLMEKFHK